MRDLGFGAAVSLLVAASVAGPAAATSNGSISTALLDRYGISVPAGTCSNCHSVSSPVDNTQMLAGWPSRLRDAFGLAQFQGLNSSDTANQAVNIFPVMDYVEATYGYPPSLRNSASGNRILTVAGDATSGSTTMATGLPFLGLTGSSSLSASGGLFNWITGGGNQGTVAYSGSTATISFATGDADVAARGERRRSVAASGACSVSNPEYQVRLLPQNATGFEALTAAVRNDSILTVCFQNIAPAPSALTKSFTLTAGTNSDVGGTPRNVLTLGAPDTDRDGSVTAAVITQSPTAAANFTSNADGSFTYTAAASNVGYTDSFRYRPRDNENAQGAEVTVNITVLGNTAGNSPPTANPDTGLTTDEDEALVIDVLANDTDPDINEDLIVSEIVGATLGSATIAGDGKSITFTPAADQNGVARVDYQISDQNGGLATSYAEITVLPVPDAPGGDPVDLEPLNDNSPPVAIDLLDPRFVSDADGDQVYLVNGSGNVQISVGTGADFDVGVVLVSQSGSILNFDPSSLDFLEDGESVTIVFTYSVTDDPSPGVGLVGQGQIRVTVTGTPNDVGRIPGEYATSLVTRYNSTKYGGHFRPSSNPAACLTCHLPGRAGLTLNGACELPSGPVFNAFGRNICDLRDPGEPPLSDLVRRLQSQEAEFAPRLAPTPATITLDEDAAIGTELFQAQVSSAGKKVTGEATEIVDYLLQYSAGFSVSAYDGRFSVDAQGRVTVTGRLIPGEYQIDVRPVNDAGQQTVSGDPLPGLPGFFPRLTTLVQDRVVTVTVNAVPVEPVADAANTEAGSPVAIDVLANDQGGTPKLVILESDPSNGTAVRNPDNTVTYTPDPGFSGTDGFTYSATNLSDDPSATVAVTVTVVGTGGLVAVDDARTVPKGASVSVDVLANDLNAVRTGPEPTVVTILDPPDPATEGTASVVGQNVEFVPVADFEGVVELGYAASNPGVSGQNGSSARIVLTIQVIDGDAIAAGSQDPELAKTAVAFGDSCALAATAGTPGQELDAFLAACAALASAAANGDDIDGALRALRNEEHLAAVEGGMTMARAMGRSVTGRIDRIRNGGVRGLDLSGISVNLDGNQVPTRDLTVVLSGLFGGNERQWRSDGTNPWGMFLSGDFTLAERDAGGTSAGYDFEATNLSAGIDYRIDADTVVGLALGISRSETAFGDGGSLDGKGFQLTAYGIRDNWLVPGLALDGYVAVGRLDFDSDRRILFDAGGASVDAVANASFGGSYVNIAARASSARVLGRYGDPLGALATDTRVTVFGQVDYLRMRIDGYTESGGGGFALQTQDETYDSLLASAGVEYSRPFYLSRTAKFEGFVSLAANAELLDDVRIVRSAFVTAGPDAPFFTVSEEGNQGIYGSAEIGGLFDIPGGSITVGYGMDFARDDGLDIRTLRLGYATRVVGNDTLGLSFLGQRAGQSRDWAVDLNYGMRF